MEKENKLKHKCCKENNFEWKSIDPLGQLPNKLICKICEREFIENGKRNLE